MTTNEETIAMDGEKNEIEEVKENKTSKEWKNVAIGGVAGIMFGAGTAYAASKMADGDGQAEEGGHAGTGGTHDVSVDSSDVATVSQEQSFSNAFAQARAAVGPGGVFRWHGGVYGTYTKDEWDAMSPEEQRQFSHNAMRVAGPAQHNGAAHVPHHVNGGHVGNNNTTTNENSEERKPEEQEHNPEKPGDNNQEEHKPDNPVTPINNDPTKREPDEPTPGRHDPSDVHVIGVHEEQIADGSVVIVGKLEGEGIDRDILVVDLDRNGTFDVAISDLNNNGKLDDGEIADISEYNIRVPNAGADQNVHLAQNKIAPNMPDYMNDADVSDVSGASENDPNTGMNPNVYTAQNDMTPDMADSMNDADVPMT